MMKKMIALVLALVLCLGLLTGCGEKTADTTDGASYDYDAAFAMHDPNEVVLTVGGEDVTWSEFYYMLFSSLSQMDYYFGGLDWDDKVLDSYDVTKNEYVMDLTLESIKQFHALNKKALDDGITLSDSDKEKMQSTIDAFKLQNCGENATEEAFNTFLLEELYLTREVYDFINLSSVYYEKLFEAYIGTRGEKLTDEDITEFVTTMPYITAKHILIKTIDDNGAALPQEEQDAAKAKAEELLAQLQGITKKKELASTFDKLMKEHSQDEGSTVFTEGYTFTKDEMYPVFEEAAFALEEYQLSDLVKSDAGYHIILRLPTTRDSMVDVDYTTSTVYTIASYAATSKYGVLISEWMQETEIVWKGEFENMEAKDYFA